jgi:hypothetical protein
MEDKLDGVKDAFGDGPGPTMTEDAYPYDKWVSNALQGVLKTALTHLDRHGFSGDHHFYINFDTNAPMVRMPGFLRAQYPEEITIVLQHQFDDLLIEDEFFEVTLSFSGQKQRLHIPFDAVKSFADPSVNFGLQIGAASLEGGAGAAAGGTDAATAPAEAPEPIIEGTTWRTGPIGEIDNADADLPASDTAEAAGADDAGDAKAAEHGGANVIALDQFRKKSP